MYLFCTTNKYILTINIKLFKLLNIIRMLQKKIILNAAKDVDVNLFLKR